MSTSIQYFITHQGNLSGWRERWGEWSHFSRAWFITLLLGPTGQGLHSIAVRWKVKNHCYPGTFKEWKQRKLRKKKTSLSKVGARGGIVFKTWFRELERKVVCAFFLLKQNILWWGKQIITKIYQGEQQSDPDKFGIFLPCLQGNELKTLVLGELAYTRNEIIGLFIGGILTIEHTGLLQINKNTTNSW